MAYRETIPSDHEWSEEEDNGIDLTDDDFDETELTLTDFLDQPSPSAIRAVVRVRASLH